MAYSSYYLFLYTSPLMPAKLKEMDDIVRTMHLRAMMDRSHDQGQTLLVSDFSYLKVHLTFICQESILFLLHIQIIVSDHGMTENGNHGGSSYEETDSLMLFIGLNSNISDYASATNNVAFQIWRQL
jgi:ethanolaminephosphotransferase